MQHAAIIAHETTALGRVRRSVIA